MKTAQVVIGANFGDEGKGLVTDYLASQTENPVVVRFNGGAQAGHTVTTPDGRRHVFHHFGSGTFQGAQSFLSRYFICNPMMFFEEWEELEKLGIKPQVFVDPDALVTTPFDMLINQIVETQRGDHRHGSCGVGINETVQRSLTFSPIYVHELNDWMLHDRLLDIRNTWLPKRLRDLRISGLSERDEYLLNNDNIIENFVLMARDFVGCTRFATMASLGDRNLIFEGAQGLLLDEQHKWFPHVTRSRTGLTNVVALADEAGIERLDTTYASRVYLTRHGAGPFPSETKERPFERIEDLTNQPNRWQGTLRFGLLDLPLLHETIAADLAPFIGRATSRLALTCVDQIDDKMIYHRGEVATTSLDQFLNEAFAPFDREGILSTGPTRDTVISTKQALAA